MTARSDSIPVNDIEHLETDLSKVTWNVSRRLSPGSPVAVEAERLIRVYPRITAKEVDLLVIIFPTLHMLDLALMTSDPSLSPRLDAFYKDHGQRIRMPALHAASILFALLVFAVFLFWFAFGR